MFTGIVQGTGSVHSIEGDSTLTFAIQIPSTDGLEVGGSVSIDGVCLTATSIGQQVTFDVIPETIHRTTLGSLRTRGFCKCRAGAQIRRRVGWTFTQWTHHGYRAHLKGP